MIKSDYPLIEFNPKLPKLSKNENKLGKIKHGLVLTGVGDAGNITYKKSRKGNGEIDKVSEYVLERSGDKYKILDFYPFGYDERQYCSPGINLGVGTFMRSQHGSYHQYHTSGDDLDFIKANSLEDSFDKIVSIIEIIESNRTFINLNPKCEPQLGSRGLYKAMNQVGADKAKMQLAMLWILNQSDGTNSLLDISKRSEIDFRIVKDVADLLQKNKLLNEIK